MSAKQIPVKALKTALANSKQFGEGSIKTERMRKMKVETFPRVDFSRSRIGRWYSRKDVLLKSTGQKVLEKQYILFLRQQNVRKMEDRLPLSMLSTHSIPNMHKQGGLDLSRCMISQPDSGERGLRNYRNAGSKWRYRSYYCRFRGVLAPKGRNRRNDGISHGASSTFWWVRRLRKLTGAVSKSRNGFHQSRFVKKLGDVCPETTTGENAKFYASIFLILNQMRQKNRAEQEIRKSNRTSCSWKWSRTSGLHFRQAEFDIYV